MHIPKPKTLWTVSPSQDRFLVNNSADEKGGSSQQYVAGDRPRLWKTEWRVVLHVQNDAMYPVPSHHLKLGLDCR